VLQFLGWDVIWICQGWDCIQGLFGFFRFEGRCLETEPCALLDRACVAGPACRNT
jgi:hypothetical protein